ncbi:MAG: IS630 family transposase [Chloroflexi bacterium]|nr:IS630 family transposase [Chloroflexota bacterium]
MEKELRTDAKHLSPKEQFQIRKNIVRLKKQGKTGAETAQILDVSRRHVESTIKKFRDEGFAGIKLQRRGRKLGSSRVLTIEQERAVRGVIIDKSPEQLRLKGCMWTRKNIAEYIEQTYKMSMPLSTLGYYLLRWGFSVQRPAKRAYKQDAKKIVDWVEREFPGIKEQAKRENAQIFFGDETGIQNTANYAKGYAPIGRTPVLKTESIKMKINMLSAVSSSGKMRFMLYKDNMNADKLIDFFSRLVKDTEKKVFLVLDNLRVHHSKKATTWVKRHKPRLEIFYLPPYTPEYNPGEYLNSDLKRGVGNRYMPRSENDLEHNIRSHMKSVQLNPYKIISFFNTPTTAYAA